MKTRKVRLAPLPPYHVSMMYATAQQYEQVFRNILLNIADSKEDIDLFTNKDLTHIFDKYIAVEGEKQRVSDFNVGPFHASPEFHRAFPRINIVSLTQDNASVLLQEGANSCFQVYDILSGNAVKLKQSEMHYKR